MIGGFLAYRGVKGVISGLVDEYTDTKPRTLPAVSGSETEKQKIIARADEFKKAVNEGKTVAPFVLSGDDINYLIHNHPGWKSLAGKIYVTIEGDIIKGDVSIPLKDIAGFGENRYINGSASFNIGLAAGRLLVFLNSMEVKGKKVPEQFMAQMRSENLAKDINSDKDAASVIEKIESITVENGQLRIVPKKTE